MTESGRPGGRREGTQQTRNGNEDFLSATPAMSHLKMILVGAALKVQVVAIGDCSGAFHQSWDLTSCGNVCQHSLDGQVRTESVGHVQCETSHDFHEDGAATIRRWPFAPI